MGTAERRERERQEMQILILDAARDLFANEGYEAVTMRKIAEKIEYSPTAIYFHFRDKLSLLRALVDRDFAAFGSALQRIGRVADPVERLRRMGYAYVDFALENPNHYRFLFMTQHPAIASEESAIRRGDPDQDAYAFLRETVAEAIAQRRFRDDLQDPDLVAQLAWGAAHGVVSLHNVKCSNDWMEWRSPRETARRLIDLAIQSMLAEQD